MIPWPSYYVRPKPTVRQKVAAITILLTIAGIIAVGSVFVLLSTTYSLDPPSARIHRIQTVSEVAAAEKAIAERERWSEQHRALYMSMNVGVAVCLVGAAIWLVAKVFDKVGHDLDSRGHWDRKIARRPARKPDPESFRRPKGVSHPAA